MNEDLENIRGRAERASGLLYLVDVDDFEFLLNEVVRLRAALEKTRREEGKVCPEFEICGHAWCQSSCTFWLIADEALRKPE